MTHLERLNSEISIYDLFDAVDPPITYLTRAKPCQISCPFHGQDTHPSARVYPDSNSFRCFYCSKSWTAVAFWAEVNNYLTSEGKLDIGRAISDLETRYNISSTVFDWQKKFYAVKKASETPRQADTQSRRSLFDYYSWSVISSLRKLSNEDRSSKSDAILSMWQELDALDLFSESWEVDLKKWYESAKLIVNV